MTILTSDDNSLWPDGHGNSAPPDLGSSSDEYARRFSGTVGAWMLGVQTRIVLDFLAPFAGASVLDVGGGHGQITPTLMKRGFQVRTLVSSDLAGARLRRLAGSKAAIEIGNVTWPPVADRGVDVAVAVRMMAHVENWRDFVAELARVADRAVLIDFPLATKGTHARGLRFRIKRMIEGDTRPYGTMSLEDVTAAFAEAGFKVERHVGQFVLPMALHRAMGSALLSRMLETLFRPFLGHQANPAILIATRI